MGQIEYRKGDMLADPPAGVHLLHACNAQGIWRSGIAKQFKEKFPKAFLDYERWCDLLGRKFEGEIQVVGDQIHPIICFVTSVNYGIRVSPPDVILRNTQRCLDQLQVSLEPGETIYSPKINSGLFNTPWPQTEEMIEQYLLNNPGTNWIVWEL